MLSPLNRGDATEVAPGWGQGRATFGGLVAALLLRRARSVLAARGESLAQKPLRTATFTLMGPLAPGAASVSAVVLRAGKSVTVVESTIVQGDQAVAKMTACLGAGRPSETIVRAATAPVFAAPGSLPAMPYAPGITPEFTKHFEMRWAVGQMPFQQPPATTGDMGGWVRFRDPTATFDGEHLLGLVDAWPPAVLPMFAAPAPISTLAWTVEFTGAPLPARADEFVQYLAATDFSADGYAHIQSRTWDPDGTLLAIGRQTIAVFR